MASHTSVANVAPFLSDNGGRCVDGAAALMLSYELGASHEVAEDRCAENFRVTSSLRLSRGGGKVV